MALKNGVIGSKFFDGSPLEPALQTLLEMDWRKGEFAIAGSAALEILSTTSLSRGLDGLITRQANDLDILITGDARLAARDLGIITESNIGKGYLISLQLEQNRGALLDLTTHWPTAPEINNAKQLAEITYDVEGLRVMKEQWVLELKEKFNRVKDRPDLKQAVKAVGQSYSAQTPMGLKRLAPIKGIA